MAKDTGLIKFLSTLGEALENNYYDINYGGCCVVAGYLALFLRHHVPTRVVVTGWGNVSLDEVRVNTNHSRNKEDWDDQGVSWSHVLVEFDYEGETWLVDSEGIIPSYVDSMGDTRYDGYLTIEEAIDFGRDARGWNDDFDRDQIPKIKKDIARAFNNYTPQQVAA